MIDIDWSKPIETVPCRRNPVPVPCEVRYTSQDSDDWADVYIDGPWVGYRNDDPLHVGKDSWLFRPDGTSNDWLPKLRNVVTPLGGSTIGDSDGDDLA
jgi:hypothetical protein